MDIYDFILTHEQEDLSRLLFKYAYMPNIKWIVQQIEGRKIAKYKLPSFYIQKYIHYPEKLSLEQCSSELSAKYKASLIQGHTFIDLTGGFGTDTVFCSKNFEKTLYIEQNADLLNIFAHNLTVLNIQNIDIRHSEAIFFLMQDKQVYSWLYIDPARRDKTGNKVFLLSDCQPDILAHWNLIRQKAQNILIKTSPLLDIKHVWQNIPVTSTHVIAVKNEVKEVLYCVEQGKMASDKIICVDLSEQERKTFIANLCDEQNLDVDYLSPQQYLYEPSKAILKAGLFKALSKQYSLHKIAPNSHLYTSQDYISGFMGRAFEVVQVIPYQKKVFQEFNTTAFNVISRNFPDTPEQIAKKLSIRMGGETDYIIATKNNEQKAILILAKRLH